MYLELANQWLKSNGFDMNPNLYYIRKSSKTKSPVEMKAVHKSSVFEIYWAETKKVIQPPKVFVPDVTNNPETVPEYEIPKKKIKYAPKVSKL
jgi:hypothetical protein